MRIELTARGVVQGVGFRPWVCTLARDLGLSGWVRNTCHAAELEVQGSEGALGTLVIRLRDASPPIRVDSLLQREIPEVRGHQGLGFRIVESRVDAGGSGALPLSADLAICSACAREVLGSTSRRGGHVFTTCTHCGPRYSIVEQLPFDRTRSTLRDFEPCAECEAEYSEPGDRRYHAQTLACPGCGPTLCFEWAEPGPAVGGDAVSNALTEAVEALARGKIVAVLGLGGFQLMVDATNDAGVARLRGRKGRPSKPLAVMFEDLSSVREHCRVAALEGSSLGSPEAPIVLVERLGGEVEGDPALSCGIAPASARIGALLPTTPLHLLLVRGVGRPLVCTSGNYSGEPMIAAPAEARRRLAGVAEAFLVHDRRVVRAVDDSVVQVVDDKLQLLRRARGYVPARPLSLPASGARRSEGRVVLALGAHQKSTVCLAFANRAFVSPHLGELNGVNSQVNYEAAVLAWCALHKVRPTELVCDLHEGQAPSILARKLAARWGIPQVAYQHHHAHIAACMAEHDWLGPVLGFAWDGAGQGLDGTLWGGEVLRCEGTLCERVGQLLPFRLPGGEKAMLEPRRAALGLLHGAGLWDTARDFGWYDTRELSVLSSVMNSGLNSPWTSSVGRLFDAAAALAGLHPVCGHEGQAAAAWMELAEQSSADAGAYQFSVDARGAWDWRPLLEEMLRDRKRSVALPVRARRFHQALANAAGVAMQRAGLPQVALGGGCFQNRLLGSLVAQRAQQLNIAVALPRRIPPNDAGVSLGQAWLGWQVGRE